MLTMTFNSSNITIPSAMIDPLSGQTILLPRYTYNRLRTIWSDVCSNEENTWLHIRVDPSAQLMCLGIKPNNPPLPPSMSSICPNSPYWYQTHHIIFKLPRSPNKIDSMTRDSTEWEFACRSKSTGTHKNMLTMRTRVQSMFLWKILILLYPTSGIHEHQSENIKH